MIDTEKVRELHTHIADLLRNEQLLKAFSKMKVLADEAADWNLRSEFENMEANYQRMLQFMLQDIAAPDREQIYYRLIMKGLILNDRLLRAVLAQTCSTSYYKGVRELMRRPNLSTIYDLAEWCRNILSTSNSAEDLYTELQSHLFNTLWTSDIWSPSDRETAASLLNDLPENLAALSVSAVSMGFLEMYDPQKYLFLFDAYQHPSMVVNQRAVVGIALGGLHHDNRMRNSEEIIQRVEHMNENPEFKRDLQNAQLHILRSRETERISKFMNEEFIPEMLRNPILKKDKSGLDHLAIEDTFNPEWEKWMESKDVKNKMNIMSQLYSTGADIHMASFANMKNFPFFRETANWFLPFDTRHPAIASVAQQSGEWQNSLLTQLIMGSEFCDSDSYSLYLFIASLPHNARDMMEKHLPNISDEAKEQLNELYTQQHTRTNICKKYTQNIYRFFKLFARKHEFTDIFQEETNLQYTDTLLPLVSDPKHLSDVANLLFNEKHFEEAETMYSHLEMIDVPHFEISQKRGFCLQQLKRYDEAIEQYEKADLMRPDNLWNLTHLAQCYNYIDDVEKAAHYYLKAEEIAPDDLNLQLQTGNCLAKSGRYEEAFKRFFKVHYLNEKSTTVWRAIAWYSLMAGKMEQAERFYSLIETNGGDKNESDLLNIGHMHWINRRFSSAVEYYKRCCEITGMETFREMILADSDDLILMRVSPMDLPLILDLVGL